MKKFLLLFPPFWDIMNIHIAYPILNAQLKVNGFDSKITDLNIKFINDVLSQDFLEKALSKIEKDWKEISLEKFLPEDKFFTARYHELKQFIENDFKQFKNMPYKIKESVEIVKTTAYEESNNKVSSALQNIYNAIKIVFLYYSTFSVHLPKEMMSYEDVKSLVLNPKYNLFYSYYKEKINSITSNEDIIGINISFSAQIIPALTLAYFLKKQRKYRIVLGGTYITRIFPDIIEHLDFFDIFTDFLLYGEGENSIVQLAKYLNNEISIDKVPGLIYKNNNKITVNKQSKNIPISKTSRPDYSDLNLSDYLIKDKIFPLQTQRGCYWKKCAFCDMSNGMNYCIKNVDNIIEELKYNMKTYGTFNYCIIDESMPPALLEKISDAIINSGLSVKFNMISRLEKKFTYKILKKAVKAGLDRAYWGIESANKRIAKLMNKGIDIETMRKILKIASDSGIKNAVFIITDFPTETYQEALDTVNFLSENKKYFDIIILYEYRLSKFSQMAKNPQKYNITICEEQTDFSTTYDFLAQGLTDYDKEKIAKMIQDINNGLHCSSKVK